LIVADTNTIAYLFLPSDFADAVEKLLAKDPHWIAPVLWRSELRNVLSHYLRKKLITFTDALEIQHNAEQLMNGHEFEINSLGVLKLVDQSTCSAYDCEFVYLAQDTGSILITADKKILRTFPDIAMKAADFVALGK
jgi:predicted nucleic acid-binding protein